MVSTTISLVEGDWRFQGSTRVADSYDVDNFLYGHCHIFALALLSYFGEDYAEAYCRLIPNGHNTQLAHVYVKINGQYFDARGKVTLEELDEYTIDVDSYEVYQINKRNILDNATDDSWGSFDKDVYEKILDFIKEFQFIYTGEKANYQQYLELKNKGFLDESDVMMIEEHPEYLTAI